MYTTRLQRDIEKTVTSGRGYDPHVRTAIPRRLQDTEIGVQIALFNMDVQSGKVNPFDAV